jgi:hypothetical protein
MSSFGSRKGPKNGYKSNVAVHLHHHLLRKQPGQHPLRGPSADYIPDRAKALALAWFTSAMAKKQVSKILNQFHLDESAIEAEAIRRSSADLERIERLLISLELRHSKALYFLAEYRGSLALQLQESANRIIETENVRSLEHIRKKTTAA